MIVTGTGKDQERLELARKLGANITINIEEENTISIIKSVTKGLGADVVIEASGSAEARKQALSIVKKCGKIGLIGLSGKSADTMLDRIVEAELKVIGSWGTIWSSWDRALDLISSRKIRVAPLITDKLSLDKWYEGFRMMEERKALKVLLVPS